MAKISRIPEGEGEVPRVNEYYLRISKKLRNVKYLLLLFMVAALILTLWAYRSRLTYDNFRYILRDIDEAGHTSLSTDAVYYTANDTNVYLYFRGDLAVGSSSGVSFHRALGSRSFEDKVTFRSPVLTGSDKYMIAYDAGGTSFYVYNSISRVYSETLDHSIISCAAASDGSFAVLTKNDVGDCVVLIYNKDFDLVGKVTRAGYAYSVGFLGDKRLYICESFSSDATLYTNISVYTMGTEDIDLTFAVQGTALDFDICGDGFAVISTLGVSFLDTDMTKTAYTSFGTSDVLYGSITEKGVCVLLDKNEVGAAEEVMVCFADGTVQRTSVPYGAKGAVLCGKKAVILYDEKLLICGDEITETTVPSGAKKLLLTDEKNVIVCYSDYAKIYEVK
ncbi:MAG: hypothetical protein IJ002_08300 [Clostridia bacterium]|nr:hypothetical protein [Clostridia bacterium]